MSTHSKKKPFDLTSLRAKLASAENRPYWKSLEEIAETPEFQDFLAHEFPPDADTWNDPVGRRRFLQLMGASLAFAGFTACTRQPEERIVPHVKAPEEIIPGKPLYFASAVPVQGYAQGVLVESHDGRPTKIEGNPDHPASLGSTTVQAQASVLDLYDPDRLDVARSAGRVRTWEAFSAALMTEIEGFRLNQGEGLRVLTGNVTSPTLSAQLEQMLEEFPQAQWHQYEPVNLDAQRGGAREAFGRPVNTLYHFDKARRILSLDADFLFHGPAALRHTKDFSQARRVDGDPREMSRLYVVESSPTTTGTMADHRLAVRGSRVPLLAQGLARQMGLVSRDVAGLTNDERAWLSVVAEDLQAHSGAAVVVPGDFQPPEVHALAHMVNEALGAYGETVSHTDTIETRPLHHSDSLAELVRDMSSGSVRVLLILSGNPAHDAPGDIDFRSALQQVPFKAHLTLHENETSELCNWQLPESHPLESWSDLRAYDGTVTVVQPLIEPIYRSRSAHELMATVLGEGGRQGYEIVRSFHEANYSGADFEKWWRRALHDGSIPDSGSERLELTVDRQAVGQALADLESPEGGEIEILFRPDPHIGDGRFLNNGWLQEAPRPLTKLTWDNAALMSPVTAERLGFEAQEVVQIESAQGTVKAPVWVQPGHPDDSVTLHLGYGRSKVGLVGRDTGFNAYTLRSADSPWSSEARLSSTGETRVLACTQDHHSLEGRPLIREATLEHFMENPNFVEEYVHEFGEEAQLYPGLPEHDGYAWGMTVDLNACIGCNACVVACQSENNIAVVGREEVAKGREMHWIRIDRYYSGEIEDPETLYQPVMCQHCETAPCETVCPVAATVHNEEGLNEMVYNRCIGTRYCSNNCPYKVRRFNFMLYSDWQTEPVKLQRNPDVTVRSRGVMEKCTYCVQRINAAKIDAKLEDRTVEDGEIRTACQQVCPADAIVFGNQNDPESEVSRLKSSPRNYGILTQFNTKPRTTYLARIRNPNPRLSG